MARKKGPNLSVGRGEKLSVSKGGGLTAKGRAKYNRATGSKLKAPQKSGPRHRSFCARSRKWKGERGKAARRRWGCRWKLDFMQISIKRESASVKAQASVWESLGVKVRQPQKHFDNPLRLRSEGRSAVVANDLIAQFFLLWCCNQNVKVPDRCIAMTLLHTPDVVH